MKREHTISVVCYKKATILHYSAFRWKYEECTVIVLIILSFFVGPNLNTNCRCRVLLLHLITHSDTHTHGGTPLDHGRPVAETSTCKIQHSQGTNTHPPSGIETRNPSKRETADPRLKPHGHWVRAVDYS